MANENKQNFASWWIKSKTAVASLTDLFFPPVCANCRKVGSLFCDGCYNQLQWVEEPICRCCGQAASATDTLCQRCSHNSLAISQIRAAVLFAEPVSNVIHKMKYSGLFGLAAPLGDLMVKAWNQWGIPIDIVAPIPLHPDREKKRGYNQSLLLAKRFGERLGIKIEANAIQRTRFTTPQVGLNASERLANVNGAFSVFPEEFIDKDVLLIDDVCTTGATMIAAAQALMTAGASSVSGYCVARPM